MRSRGISEALRTTELKTSENQRPRSESDPVDPSSTGTSLSRSLKGIPNWLLRDIKSPIELQPCNSV